MSAFDINLPGRLAHRVHRLPEMLYCLMKGRCVQLNFAYRFGPERVLCVRDWYAIEAFKILYNADGRIAVAETSSTPWGRARVLSDAEKDTILHPAGAVSIDYDPLAHLEATFQKHEGVVR